jgi:hypothetical protein
MCAKFLKSVVFRGALKNKKRGAPSEKLSIFVKSGGRRAMGKLNFLVVGSTGTPIALSVSNRG